jgi:carbon starvation protein
MTAELLGPIASPFKNRFVETILPVLLAYLLAASGSEGTLWPMFGAANQLVAALALLVVTVYLARLGRPKLYTLVPAIFMLITTVAALLWKGRSLLTAKQPQYGLSIATLVLLALAVYVSIEGLSAIRREQIS